MRGELFSGTRAPRPPADLKERALRAARAAARESSAPGRASWGFRRLDLVWVAALLLLLACNAWLTLANRPGEALTARRSAPASLEAPIVLPEGEPDLLALGLRVEADSARREEPSITLGQVLRDGS